MADVDMDSLILSMKVLGIMFILAISSSSVILLIKLVQHPDVFTVRRLMVIILTAGILLYSFFPLVVNVREQFEPMVMSCRTKVMASVYENFYFPFVYAVGLLALALELSIVKRGSSGLPRELIRLAYVAFPWIFGCVLVLPLTMAGIQWDNQCYESFSYARHRSFVWVCNLLPACAVITVAIFLAFKIGGVRDDYTDEATMAYSASTQCVVHSSSSSSSHGGGFQSAGYNGNQQQMGPLLPSVPPPPPPPAPPPAHSQQQQRPDSAHFHHPPHDFGAAVSHSHQTCMYQVHQPSHNHHKHHRHKNHHHHRHTSKYHPSKDNLQHQHRSQQPPPQHPPPPPPNYAPPPPGFGTPYYEIEHNTSSHNQHHKHQNKYHNNNNHHHQQQHHHQNIPHSNSFTQQQTSNNSRTNTNTSSSICTSTIQKSRDIRNEAKTFAKVSALFVFCSLPQAIFNLAYLMNEDRVWLDTLSTTVISHLVAWLTVLRWLLLTICWTLSIK